MNGQNYHMARFMLSAMGMGAIPLLAFMLLTEILKTQQQKGMGR